MAERHCSLPFRADGPEFLGVRRVGPTAAAKLLYFVRSCAVTAWDEKISLRTGGGRDQAAFLRHLTTCRGWAASLEAEGWELGLKPGEIGPHLGRPVSSVAKVIDEWLYATITGGLGLGPGEPEYPRWAVMASETDPCLSERSHGRAD